MKLMKSLLLMLFCSVALLMAGCGDDSDLAGPVEDDNLPPAISGPASVSATVGAPVTFELVATDPDGDPLDLSISAVVSLEDWRAGIRPGGASINSETSEITFTPNANDSPRRILAITAEDPSGETASIDVLVLVSNP